MSKRFIVLVVTGVQLALLAAILPAPARAEGVKRAVLIGVDEYLSGDVSDLRGCGNDVDLMESVLVGKFDFAPDDVEVLKNEDATREAIIGLIRSHLGQSEAGDIALVHYSGHGSQMLDKSGDEADGKDETIVPHDSRQGDVFDINDDEINGLMKEISERTSNVVFILDSCHSGTAARAVASGNVARKTPADERPPPDPEPWALGSRGFEESADGIRLPGANYVLISGCRANELSNETVFDGARHGALTFFLARALKAARDQTTYRDVMEQVKADVSSRFSLQHPQLEGTGSDTKIFGSERILPRPYVLVEAEGAGAKVRAGKVFGVEAGTVLPVYPPGTKVFDGTVPATGKVRVTDVEDFSASATIVEGTVAGQSRTVLTQVRPPAYRAGLFLNDADSSALLQGIAEAIAEDEAIEIVSDRSAAEMRAAVEGEGEGSRFVLRGRELQILSETAATSADAVQKSVAQIRHWARWFGLLAIDNPGGGDLPVDFRIERVGAEPGDAAPETIAPGDSVRIAVTNQAEKPVHLTLLDFRRTGEVVVLHPPPGIPEPMEPGETWEQVFPAGIPEGLDEDVDIVKAIVTTDEIPSSVFAQGVAPRAVENALERYLRLFNQGERALLTPVAASGWTTQKRVLRVARPGVENRGFIAHYETADAASRAPDSLTRADTGTRSEGSFAGDPTMVEVSTPGTRAADPSVGSVGSTFQQAYDFRAEACAADPEACPLRVEPMLEQELEQSQSAPLAEDRAVRGFGGSDPLPVAENDTVWSHKYTRVPEAWELLRSDGKPAGSEAAGVVIAHPDTGYLRHPEIWDPPSDRPILFDKGWDYFEGDAEPVDKTEKERLLDNPVHGTGSSSAIISRAGCQLADTEKCPTGVAQGAHLVPLRVNSSVINFSGKRLARALLDASGTDRSKVKVDTDLAAIAMGGPPSWALWKAVRKAEERGFIVIAAAGNYVRTVVWPARYDAVISVAAVNANCEPWAHSSRGSAVDIAAPGESVWRATLDKEDTLITGMGTGTTYGTATTGGIAALWVAKHKGTPAYEALKSEGRLTSTLRDLMQQTSWRPGTAEVPDAAQCKAGVGWADSKYGAGILDARRLLEAPLPDAAATRGAMEAPSPRAETIAQLPLWSSLYPAGTPLELIQADYRRLFGVAPDSDLEEIALYEAEVTYHYAANESVAEAVDQLTGRGERDESTFGQIRERLRIQDLSASLRNVLQ